jgi:hypothetical protein
MWQTILVAMLRSSGEDAFNYVAVCSFRNLRLGSFPERARAGSRTGRSVKGEASRPAVADCNRFPAHCLLARNSTAPRSLPNAQAV